MTITKRLVKGSPLTAVEFDGNLDDLIAQIAAKAALASPALTGTPTAPTAVPGTNTTQIATAAFVQAAVAALVASSPAALDTLNELAAALGNDANFAATVTSALAGKAAVSHTHVAGNLTAVTGQSVIARLAGSGAYQELSAGTNSVLLRVAGDLLFGKLSTVHFNNTIITNAILANMTAPSIKGRIAAGAGPVEDLTPAQVVSILDTELGGTAWRATAAGGGATYFNGSGGTLAKGTPVALASFDAGSGNPGMVAADADGSGLMPCIGILGAAVANGASGAPIISGGEITGLDTSAYALGDKLYVSTTAGVLTKVRPTTGFIQAVAVVSRVDAVNGEIIVQIEEAGELYTEYLMMAASDEATNLSVGTAKITLWAPFAMVITKIKANVITAPTGSTLQVDVNEAGVSIFSTPITIDAGEDTSETAAVPQVISDANIANNAKITVDIDQVGATVAGKGLKLTFYGYRA